MPNLKNEEWFFFLSAVLGIVGWFIILRNKAK